ncbi:MAG: PH domain-containing protein [Candidatus Pacebacteria bacterium]|nr:PH domain-containing protein [Candidatus Paceibacterota bacterium]
MTKQNPKAVIEDKRPELEKVKEEKKAHPMAAFVPVPSNWRFETQEKKEKIILLLRRHWFTNLSWFLAGVFFFILPGILFLFVSFDFMPLRFRVVGLVIWYLVLAGYFFERFLNWYFNVFIITDERIIDFDFFGLIYKEVSDAKIEDIQDVTYRVGGFVRNLFDFGDVFFQTSAELPRFEFRDVPQPARVARVLRELITEEEIEKMEGRIR